MNNLSEKEKIEKVEEDAFNIQYIDNPSEELQLIAVNQIGITIQFIKNPSEEVCLAACHQDGMSIEFIKNPSETVQLEAVKDNGSSIRFIKNPPDIVQVEALKNYHLAFEHIKVLSEAAQFEMIRQEKEREHPDFLKFFNYGRIKNPTKNIMFVIAKQLKETVCGGIGTGCRDNCYFTKQYGCNKENKDSVMLRIMRKQKLEKLLDK